MFGRTFIHVRVRRVSTGSLHPDKFMPIAYTGASSKGLGSHEQHNIIVLTNHLRRLNLQLVGV